MYMLNVQKWSHRFRLMGHNIQKTRPNRVSPTEAVGLAETPTTSMTELRRQI